MILNYVLLVKANVMGDDCNIITYTKFIIKYFCQHPRSIMAH